jgi:release factor glutamine methyltransferase
MTANECLSTAVKKLEQAGIGTARLDTLVLMEDVLGKDRAWLLAHPEMEISSAQQAKLKKLFNQRARHMPLAYVRGHTEFYGHDFLLTPDVLEPRPESETMIDLLLKLPKLGTRPDIADVGTGSGALGITAKLALPEAEVDLIDISPNALKTAKMNVDKFTLNISVLESDLLVTAVNDYDVLLCNLPYVPDGYSLNEAASHEPRIAIFGGEDGLDVYRKLFKQLENRTSRPLYILTEALPFQHTDLQAIAKTASYEMVQENDFIQVFSWVQ